MRIDELAPAPGARTAGKRLGRGTGSGLGKTSGKGHKGQWARSGGGVRKGFEGGQMPLTRTLPKHGFTSNWRKVYSIVNVGALEVFENGATVDAEALVNKGILSKVEQYGLKVLGDGTLTKKLNVIAAKFTKSAEEAVKAAGGTVEVK
ncbi:MAG: 50S ribosomal protein L15 [Firmicutes bacterium]|nr:50S ribosomal protein L15 [Bacillota bacterium]